ERENATRRQGRRDAADKGEWQVRHQHHEVAPVAGHHRQQQYDADPGEQRLYPEIALRLRLTLGGAGKLYIGRVRQRYLGRDLLARLLDEGGEIAALDIERDRLDPAAALMLNLI